MKEFDVKKEIIGFFRKNTDSFVSGEEMSALLGFSRASVWKYIKKLREEGYVIEAVPRRGYRLCSVPDRLYGYDIACGLGTRTIGKGPYYVYESIGSTNDRAYELAEAGAPEGTLVIAETQTRGKGRIGRTWVSPKKGGVYMSIVLRPDIEIDVIPAITLVTAVSIVRVIKKTCKMAAGIKWPNDILINRKKVCGILTEIKAQPDRVDFVVLGIGVNVNTSTGKLPPEGTSLKTESSVHLDRVRFTRRTLETFEDDYLRLQSGGFSLLRDECKAMSLVLGKRLTIREHRRTVDGVAVDIDKKGALIVRADDGAVHRIFSGDVVL